MSIETRGRHAWTLSGLLKWGPLYYVRVYKDTLGPQNKIQAVHISETKTSFIHREICSLSTNIVELANEGRDEHRASREAGDGAHCGREGRKLYPDRMVARCSRGEGQGAYEAEREVLLFEFLF